jgi:hypothetical protein
MIIVITRLSRRPKIEIRLNVVDVRLENRRNASSNRLFDDFEDRRDVVDESNLRLDHAELGQVATASTHFGSVNQKLKFESCNFTETEGA